MRTHPVFLRLDGRRCVIVGGDEAAARKAHLCLILDRGSALDTIGVLESPEDVLISCWNSLQLLA